WRRKAQKLDVLERCPIELDRQLRDAPDEGSCEVAQCLHCQRRSDLDAVPLDHEGEEQRCVRWHRRATAQGHARRTQDASQEPDGAALRYGALLSRFVENRVLGHRERDSPLPPPCAPCGMPLAKGERRGGKER